MLRIAVCLRASGPGIQIAPETTPVKFIPQMLPLKNSLWYNGIRNPFLGAYRERSWLHTWPAKRYGWEKFNRNLLYRMYSPEALRAALDMIPPGFEVQDVPRPPQRILAQSEGIVGRWYTNYWTLHSIKYQCLLAGVPWRHGEKDSPVTNFEEPYIYVDYEETKAIRDWRSRWINVNRALVGMSRRMKEVNEENRYVSYRYIQDSFWSNRRVLINRVKAMKSQGTLSPDDKLPIRTLNVEII